MRKLNYVIVLIVLLFSATLYAQTESEGCSINTINPGFEEPQIAAGSYSYVTENSVPGWNTTATDHVIEIWSSGFIGVSAYLGNQFAELNATQVSGLYQDFDTSVYKYFKYEFAHRGRQGIDVMRLRAGPPGGPYVDVTISTANNTAWSWVTGTYQIPAGQNTTRFIFEAVSSTGNIGTGNFLDAISFTGFLPPPVISSGPNESMAEVEYCQGANATPLTATGPGLLWYTQPNGGTGTTTAPTPSTSAIGTTHYYVSQTIDGCESGRAEFVVTVIEKEVPEFSFQTEYCEGDTVATLSTTSDNGYAGTWSPSTINNTTSGNYTFTPTSGSGCVATKTMHITINPKPVVSNISVN